MNPLKKILFEMSTVSESSNPVVNISGWCQAVTVGRFSKTVKIQDGRQELYNKKLTVHISIYVKEAKN